jgi:ribose 5-phosphate isomerase RpiB
MKKQRKPNGWQRVAMLVQTGDVYTKEQLVELLKDKKIHMYRISNYMLDIKLFAKGVIKPVKDGRKVTGYQVCNPEVVQAYLRDNGFLAKDTMAKKTKAKKLTDISQPVTETVAVSEQTAVVSE